MILDFLATRLAADHGRDFSDTVARAATRLPAVINQSLLRAGIGTVGMAICAAVCLIGATAPAAAAPAADTVRTQAVGYADLDLSSRHGRALLDHRIRAAAHAVCDTGSANSVERWARIAEQRCFRNAVASAGVPSTVTADAR